MKPYYQSSTVTAYHCRFQEIVSDLPSSLLVVSDPPYNIGFKYDQHKDNMPDKEYIEMLAELKKFERVILCDYPIETMKYIVPALGVPDEVVAWCYNSQNPKRFRLVSFYGCKPDYTREERPYLNKKPSKERQEYRERTGKTGVPLYEWWSDIQQVRVGKDLLHPCPVPEALQRRIITLCANEGDVIFDPFGGSLTTSKAAQDLGFKSIACELSESYLREGIGRLAQQVTSTLPNNRLHLDVGDSPAQKDLFTLEAGSAAGKSPKPAPRR